MFYTYSETFIGDFSEEIWNTHHVHSSLILLDQPPTSRQSFLGFPSDTADYAFVQPMHLVPQIDGTARFTRHPAEPWRIVPAWNSTYGCNIMYAAKPDNGRFRFSLDHAGDVGAVLFSALALANNGSSGGEAFDVFKDSIPGVKWDGFRVDEIVLPLCYIHHNGHAAEGPGSRNGVGVYAEIPTDTIDEQISGDYAIEIVAYRPKIAPHPEVTLDIFDAPPEPDVFIWSFDMPTRTTSADVVMTLEDTDNEILVGGVSESDYDLSTDADFDAIITAFINEVHVFSSSFNVDIAVERLPDYYDGSPLRYHLEIAVSNTDLLQGLHTLDIVDNNNAANNINDAQSYDYEPLPERKAGVKGSPDKWAIIADATAEPDVTFTPKLVDGPNYDGNAWEASSEQFMTDLDDVLPAPYDLKQTGFQADQDGYAPTRSKESGEDNVGAIVLGQLDPGPWIIAARYRRTAPSTATGGDLADEIEHETAVLWNLVDVIIDQKPRNCPWAMLKNDATVVPGGLPTYAYPLVPWGGG